MDYSIREIQSQDNELLAQVIRTVLEEHGMNKPGTVYTDPTTDELYELFQTEKSVYYVVVLNNEIVGGCGIYPTNGLPEGCAELVKLYLRSDSRGLGLGKTLLDRCAETASKLGYRKLYLESMPELSKAVGLYESVGYEQISSPMGNSGHFACDLWMIKELD
ncbi:GNAT family N-acetyltransferase [Crocinitomicaceae bacterium]|nr:GNAT family N-acetyltransferase [Crocinitomicaceae bacterium]